MGKSKGKRRRDSTPEKEKSLRKRIALLERQILRQTSENRRSVERQSERSLSRETRSQSRNRSCTRYDDDDYYHHNKKKSRYGDRRSRINRRERSCSSARGPSVSTERQLTSSDNSPRHLSCERGERLSEDVIVQTNLPPPIEVTAEANKENVPDEPAGGSKDGVQDIDPEVLEIFGEQREPDRLLAPPINSHLAVIWQDIIKKGLPSEERKITLKNFPPPENCVRMKAPKLNLEVKAALDNTIQKRDERIVEKQEKIAASLAGVAKTIETVLKSNPPEKKQYLEPLNGVAKLLADLQHDETAIRKNLILMNIKSSFKETLKDSSSDEWLFGSDISQRLKAAKVLQKSSNAE